MTRATWVLMIAALVVAGGCAAGAQRPPPVSAQARAAKPVDWARRDPTARPWRAPGKRVQMVVSHGWAAGEYYAWFVANGSDVLAVFRCRDGELSQVAAEYMGDMTRAEVGSPADALSWGILGGLYKPP